MHGWLRLTTCCTTLIRGRRPDPVGELIGYGRNINRDVLEQKKEQYDESLATQGWVEMEMLRPIVGTAMVAVGDLACCADVGGGVADEERQPGPAQI